MTTRPSQVIVTKAVQDRFTGWFRQNDPGPDLLGRPQPKQTLERRFDKAGEDAH